MERLRTDQNGATQQETQQRRDASSERSNHVVPQNLILTMPNGWRATWYAPSQFIEGDHFQFLAQPAFANNDVSQADHEP